MLYVGSGKTEVEGAVPVFHRLPVSLKEENLSASQNSYDTGKFFLP